MKILLKQLISLNRDLMQTNVHLEHLKNEVEINRKTKDILDSIEFHETSLSQRAQQLYTWTHWTCLQQWAYLTL